MQRQSMLCGRESVIAHFAQILTAATILRHGGESIYLLCTSTPTSLEEHILISTANHKLYFCKLPYWVVGSLPILYLYFNPIMCTSIHCCHFYKPSCWVVVSLRTQVFAIQHFLPDDMNEDWRRRWKIFGYIFF